MFLQSTSDVKRPRHLVRWLSIVAVVAAVVAVVYIRWGRPKVVVTAAVVRGRAVEAVYATGTVEPLRKVVVKARISEHIAALLVEAGDTVTAGQLLARIENPLRTFALAQGRIELTKAQTQAGGKSPQLAGLQAQAQVWRAQLALAQRDLARTTALAKTGAVTQQELDAALAQVAQLGAQAAAADSAQRSTRLELGASRDQLASQVQSLASEVDDGLVNSPSAGVVLRRDVELGEVVAANQALFEIAEAGDLQIELRVDEADIARVKDGATGSVVALSFYAFAGQAFEGRVLTVMPEPDRVRRSYTVKVALAAPIPGLRVGMTAEANIIVQRKDDVLLLPAESVVAGQAWFVVGGHAVQRPVTIGVRDLANVEVIAGAALGDRAIVNATTLGLKAGQRVRERAVTASIVPQASAATPSNSARTTP